MKKKKISCLAILFATLFVFAGCGSAKYTENSSCDTAASDVAATESAAGYYDENAWMEEKGEMEVVEDASMDIAEADPTNGGSDLGTKSEEVEHAGRKLIKRYNLSVETREFEELISYIQTALNGTDGYIESSSLSGTTIDGGGSRSAYFTLRVPVSDADSFLAELGKQAHITYQSEEVEDVTLAYVDTKSRIESLRIEQETLMEMLEQADTLENIIAIQSRLTEVRYQIESYESQIRTYDNLVEYTTISVDVYEVLRETSINDGSFGERLKDNFSDGFYNFGQSVQNFVIWLAGAVPVLLVLIVILIVLRFALKKIKKPDHLPGRDKKAKQSMDFGIDSFDNVDATDKKKSDKE